MKLGRDLKLVNVECHSFLVPAKRSDGFVIDCGCNAGNYADWWANNSNASVLAFEPDPRLFQVLPNLPNVSFFNKAIAGKAGKVLLNLGKQTCSSVVFSEPEGQESVWVESVTLDEVLSESGRERISLLKMDIEGAELDVLEQVSDTLLRSVDQLTVEFHDFINRKDVPRIVAISNRLIALDFLMIKFSTHTWGDTLFVNRNTLPLSQIDIVKLNVFHKWLPGISRTLSKAIPVRK